MRSNYGTEAVSWILKETVVTDVVKRAIRPNFVAKSESPQLHHRLR